VISAKTRRRIREYRKRAPKQPLTPIPCAVCGWMGSGRWANRSTVCWRCRRKFRKELEAGRKAKP